MFPVALSDPLSYFGLDNDELHVAAANAQHECCETRSRSGLEAERVFELISCDLGLLWAAGMRRR